MNIVKKIFNTSLIILTAFMFLISCVYVYYLTFGKNKVPTSVTSTYTTLVNDPQTGETLPFIEVNYYSNQSGNGYEVVDLCFNAYSGPSKQAIYSRGFQLVTTEGKSKLYQYGRNQGVSFESGHEYKWGDPMYTDIDGTTYVVKLDGTYKITTKRFNFAKAVGHTFAGLFTGYNYEEKAYTFDTKEYQYTFEDLCKKFASILRSCSNGTGDGIIPIIDMGDFLHVYAVDENGNASNVPLGGDFINSYFTVSTHYDQRGMVHAKQSIFKSVAYDSQFNISGVSDDAEYWQSKSVIELTEKDFEESYLKTEDGYLYGLSIAKIKELKSFDDVEINILFDISKIKDKKVLGFNNYALFGIKVKSLTIKSDIECDFKLLMGSLKDTGITNVNVVNVNLVDIDSGVTL